LVVSPVYFFTAMGADAIFLVFVNECFATIRAEELMHGLIVFVDKWHISLLYGK
jgi:hypothetical protein